MPQHRVARPDRHRRVIALPYRERGGVSPHSDQKIRPPKIAGAQVRGGSARAAEIRLTVWLSLKKSLRMAPIGVAKRWFRRGASILQRSENICFEYILVECARVLTL